MERVLTNWGRGEGYDPIADFDSPVRIDLIWRKNKQDMVAIEHENVGDMHGKPLEASPIHREVEKLLDSTSAPLRILITYFREAAFPQELLSFRTQLEAEIQSRGKYNFEFLLMAGPWEISYPNDFVAYVYKPKIDAEFIPPNYSG